MSEHALSAIIVAATVLRNRIPKDAPLEERCRAAFREALKPDNGATFMCSSDDEVFRAAVAAVILADCPANDKLRIGHTLTVLHALSAATQGIPVDWDTVFEMVPSSKTDMVPLLGWWHEEKARGQA